MAWAPDNAADYRTDACDEDKFDVDLPLALTVIKLRSPLLLACGQAREAMLARLAGQVGGIIKEMGDGLAGGFHDDEARSGQNTAADFYIAGLQMALVLACSPACKPLWDCSAGRCLNQDALIGRPVLPVAPSA